MILYTAFLLNFLEAFILVYGTHILDSATRHNKFKISIKLLLRIWILGIINCVIQFIPLIATNDVFIMFYNVAEALVIMPLILYLYTNIFICRKTLGVCYKSIILYVFTLIISVIVFDSSVASYVDVESILIEKVFQLIVIFGVDKIVKRFLSTNYNGVK